MLNQEVENQLLSIFQLHDSIRVELNPLIPSHNKKTILRFDKINETGKIQFEPVRMPGEANYIVLTKKGLLMDLTKNMMLPWARQCSKMEFQCVKAYFTSKEQEGFTYEHKNTKSSLYFTIVMNRTKEEPMFPFFSSFYMAEVIFVTIHSLLQFQKYFEGYLSLEVSHTCLFDLLYQKLNTKKYKVKRENLLIYVQNYGKNNVDHEKIINLEKEIAKGSEERLKILRDFAEIETGDIKKFRSSLLDMFSSSQQLIAVETVIEAIERVIALVYESNFSTVKFVFVAKPKSKITTIFHAGIFFSAYIEGQITTGKKTKGKSKIKRARSKVKHVLACGGNFKNLIYHFLSVGSVKQIEAYGVKFYGHKLVDLIRNAVERRSLKSYFAEIASDIPSVFIGSFSEDMVAEKFRICSRVWEIGVKAYFSIISLPGYNGYIRGCKERRINIIILLKPGMFNLNSKLKIRNLEQNREQDIDLVDLQDYLKKYFNLPGLRNSSEFMSESEK